MLHVRLVKRGEDLMCCLAGGTVLPFIDPHSQGRENQRVRVHIDPLQISLLRTPDGNSDGSKIHGRIVSISGEKGRVRIVVDIGLDLQVLMDEKQFFSESYQVLQEVDVAIPQQGIQLMS